MSPNVAASSAAAGTPLHLTGDAERAARVHDRVARKTARADLDAHRRGHAAHFHLKRRWRDMKGALALRPVFHHRDDRIRAHVQLCWLALLLLRVIENSIGDTWRNAALSARIQELAGIDYGNGRGRRTVARLRRELINVPARVARRGGVTWLRLPPGEQLLATVLPRLQRLAAPG